MLSSFRGVFLTSAAPDATAQFYREVAGLALDRIDDGSYAYWRVDRDGVQIAIHEASAFATYASPPNPDSNLTHLYFTIEDTGTFLTHLRDLGIDPLATDDVVITVVDPDGREVIFGTA